MLIFPSSSHGELKQGIELEDSSGRWLEMVKAEGVRSTLPLRVRIRNLCLEPCLFLCTWIPFSPVLYMSYATQWKMPLLLWPEEEVKVIYCHSMRFAPFHASYQPGSLWRGGLGGCDKAALTLTEQDPEATCRGHPSGPSKSLPKAVSLFLSWVGLPASVCIFPA